MENRKINVETSLYAAIFLLALVLRLYHLGVAPLSDLEASWAMRGLELFQSSTPGSDSGPGAQPGYVILTGLVFYLFGSSNFLARLWPALAGAFMVWTPFFFRRELGRTAAMITALGLAIDPGLVATSRLAGGPILSVSFMLFAIGFFWAGSPALAGTALGFALISGPETWIGIIGVAAAGIAGRRIFQRTTSQSALPDLKPMIRPTLISAGATVLIAATFFLRFPLGLSGFASTLTEFLSGWITPGNTPAAKLIAALLIYQPLGALLILSRISYWLIRQSVTNELVQPPPLWPLISLSVSLAIVLLYPARQVTTLAWVLVPLWVFTAVSLSELLPRRDITPVSLILAALLFVLQAMFWNTLTSSRQIISITALDLPGNTAQLVVQLVLFLGVVGLGGLSVLLVSLGWSPRVGRDGLVVGLAAGLIVYLISAMWGASQLRQNQPEELWAATPSTGQVDLFLSTLKQISERNTGFPEAIDITSIIDAPSMRWALRDFEKAEFVTSQPPGELPSVVITTSLEEEPALRGPYQGQDFVWWVRPGWSGSVPDNFVDWLVSRQAPHVEEEVILWVRSDLFPGEGLEASSE